MYLSTGNQQLFLQRTKVNVMYVSSQPTSNCQKENLQQP